MPSATTKAKTKFSGFEYLGGFAEPVLEPLRIMSIANAVYAALKPWNISPQNVKYPGGTMSPTSPLYTFELANSHYTVEVAMAHFAFKAVGVAWDQAPVIIKIIESTANALSRELKATVAEHSLTITMQLAIAGKSIRELTSVFATSLAYPAKQDLEFYGLIAYTKDGFYVVDRSGADPKDLFVKIVRKYKGSHDLNDMAKALNDDEQGLAKTLGIEIE